MMLAWSFSARTVDEVAALLRALGKHRYVREVDHRLHWSVDVALAEVPAFAPHAAAFLERAKNDLELDAGSRDPSLWRNAHVEEVVLALSSFWTPGPLAERARARLVEALSTTGLPAAEHAPFASDPEDPPHPELLLLDWVLHPVDELDAERHAGALGAMEVAGEEIDVSAPVYQEAACIALPELLAGAPRGVLTDDFVVWSDGPCSYSDYVFRGAAKIAKLVDPPVGPEDLG